MASLQENMAALAQIQKSPSLGFNQMQSRRLAPGQLQAQQLDLLQGQHNLEQSQLNAPLDREFKKQQIAESQSNIDLKQEEIKREKTLAFGRLAKVYESLPDDQREQFLTDTKMFHGLEPSQATPEFIKNISQAYDVLNPTDQKVGRYKQSVVGGKLVLVDSTTGDQQVMDLTPDAEAPEGFTDEQKKLWSALPPSGRQKIIEKRLDPNTQIKTEEKLKTIKKKEQFKKVAIDLIDKISQHKELPNVLGPIEGNIDFRFEDAEAELITDIKELESILTGENLDLMSGVLSESDIAILRRIGAGGISRVRSPQEFKRRLDELRNSLTGFDQEEIPKPQTMGDFEALPVGSFYIDPADNKKYRKK